METTRRRRRLIMVMMVMVMVMMMMRVMEVVGEIQRKNKMYNWERMCMVCPPVMAALKNAMYVKQVDKDERAAAAVLHVILDTKMNTGERDFCGGDEELRRYQLEKDIFGVEYLRRKQPMYGVNRIKQVVEEVVKEACPTVLERLGDVLDEERKQRGAGASLEIGEVLCTKIVLQSCSADRNFKRMKASFTSATTMLWLSPIWIILAAAPAMLVNAYAPRWFPGKARRLRRVDDQQWKKGMHERIAERRNKENAVFERGTTSTERRKDQ